jgi:uncharacterized protein YjaG (DUF416 family)
MVPLADYDSALKADLNVLPQRTRAAFAAACAERLFPAYAAFLKASGRDDHGLVRRTLDLAWDGARSGAVPLEDPADLFEQCVALIPGDESEDDAIPAHADDGIASAAYALQAAAGLDDKAAGWAAERVTNSLDTFLLSNEIDISEPEAEQRVWEHSLVAAEISRRKDDLRRLADATDWEAAVDAVRAMATGVSALPLDQLNHET